MTARLSPPVVPLDDGARGKLIAAREAAGLSITALAERIRLNRVVLSYYESGARQPNSATLDRWCEALGLAVVIPPPVKIVRRK